jgi:transposase
LHDELVKRKHLTLQLLWQEYKEGAPAGYQYSQFCVLYRQWRKQLDRPMRQEHRAGEKLFVDYSGQIVNAATGGIREAQLLVGGMDAATSPTPRPTGRNPSPTGSAPMPAPSSFSAPTLVHSAGQPPIRSKQNLPLRAGAEPVLRRTCGALRHRAVIPARVHQPKDKAKVEGGVLIAQRFILTSLRKRTFFSLTEANAAIWERLALLNLRPFKKLPGCRQSRFAEIDRPAMLPLPESPHQFAVWK